MTETIDNANAAASTLFLGHNGEWWDFWLIISGIAVALAATAIAVMTTGSIISHKREAAAAERELGRYKLETGRKISEANAAGDAARADAERARAEAAKATERAAAAQADAAHATERASALEVDAAKARERTAALAKETAEAKAGIAAADARAAEANARAAQAQLALEKLKTPRTLSSSRQQFVADATRPFAGQKYRAAVSQAADDGIAFWESLYSALEQAGWTYIPMPPGQPAVGVHPAGIPIAAAPGVEILFNPTNEAAMLPAALALGNAIHADKTVVAVNRDNMNNPNEAPDIILIRIGARVPPPE